MSSLLLAVALAPVSSAAIVEVDVHAPGDRLVTRDTAAGLDWLDLTQTTSLSFDDVIAGSRGWVEDGWRYATGTEVCGLFDQLAFTPERCPDGNSPTVGDPTLNAAITSLLGVTAVGVSGGDGARGLWNDEDPTSTNVGLAYYLSDSATSSVAVISNSQEPFFADPTIGSFLVRPVPEPSVSLVLGACLLLLWKRMTRFGRGGSSPPETF